MNEQQAQRLVDAERSLEAYWVVIPHSVLSSKELTSSDKCVYGEISSLTRRNGYCYATNQHIADAVALSQDRVSKIVAHLAEVGLIDVEITKENGGTYRKIWLVADNGGGSRRQRTGVVADDYTEERYTKEIQEDTSDTPLDDQTPPFSPQSEFESEDEISVVPTTEEGVPLSELRDGFGRRVDQKTVRVRPYTPRRRTNSGKRGYPTTTPPVDPYIANYEEILKECETVRGAKFVGRTSQHKALSKMREAGVEPDAIIRRFSQLHNDGKEPDMWKVVFSFDKKPPEN